MLDVNHMIPTDGNRTRISIEDVEEFVILTDDILNILRYRRAFYDDDGNLRYFENVKEYQREMADESNFIVEHLIHSSRYLNEGCLLNTPADDIFRENLLPLQKLILSLYRNGTGQDCFYCVDGSFSDRYLLKAFTLRVIDSMLCEAGKRPVKDYFLTWMASSCHDMDEWVGIAHSREELRALYEKTLKEEEDMDYRSAGEKLIAFEYIDGKGFCEIDI